MTTKEYLSQIQRMNDTIKNKIAEIEQLKAIATNATVKSNGERVQSSGDKDKIGSAVADIVDTENELRTVIAKRRAIIKQIESIQNSDYYNILTKRYVLGKFFKEISADQHKTVRHVGRIHDKALREFEKMYGYLYNR